MTICHYIGFDVHKKSISYCVKTADGRIVEEGKLRATHDALRQWAGKRQGPWHGAMEATLFSGWIYDVLEPFAAELQMGHPALMKVPTPHIEALRSLASSQLSTRFRP